MTTSNLFNLNSKIESLVSGSSLFLNTATRNYRKNETFTSNDVTVRAVNDISKGSTFCVIKEGNTYLAISSEDNSRPSEIIRQQTVLSRHTRPLQNRLTAGGFRGAVVYSIIDNDTDEIVFWIKTEEFEKEFARIPGFVTTEEDPTPINGVSGPVLPPASGVYCPGTPGTRLYPPDHGNWRLIVSNGENPPGSVVPSTRYFVVHYTHDTSPEHIINGIVDTEEFPTAAEWLADKNSRTGGYTLVSSGALQMSPPGMIDINNFTNAVGSTGGLHASAVTSSLSSRNTIYYNRPNNGETISLVALRNNNCSFITYIGRATIPGTPKIYWFPASNGALEPPLQFCDPTRRPVEYPLKIEETDTLEYRYRNQYEIFLYKEERNLFHINLKHTLDLDSGNYTSVTNFLVNKREVVVPRSTATTWRPEVLEEKPAAMSESEISNICFREYATGKDVNIYDRRNYLLEVDRNEILKETSEILISSIEIIEEIEELDEPLSLQDAYCNPSVNNGLNLGSLSIFTSVITFSASELTFPEVELLQYGTIQTEIPKLGTPISWSFKNGVNLEESKITLMGKVVEPSEDLTKLYWNTAVNRGIIEVEFPLTATLTFSVEEYLKSETDSLDLKLDKLILQPNANTTECNTSLKKRVTAKISSPQKEKIENIVVYKF